MDSSSTTTERRKQVRVRLRRDLQITAQTYDGRRCAVVKDPISQRYFRFQRREQFLLGLMDGAHTLDDAREKFDRQFRPERLRLEEVEGFAHLLVKAGLAHSEAADGRQLFARYREHRRDRRLRLLSEILYTRIPLFDPDRLLARLLVPLRWLFTTWLLLASGAFVAAAVALVTLHFDAFRSRLPSFYEFFTPANLVYLWGALALVKIVHELGHGLSCKAFGGECHEMGALLLCLSPALYCNVSDAWMLSSKWQRIVISFAGIYVELIIAAIATFVWWNTPGQPFINNMSLSLMVVCSISTVLFNGNPLMRYDGYYMLADWLEIPNLRERADRCLRAALLQHSLGIEPAADEALSIGRRWFLSAYAVAAFSYRWLVTGSILWFLHRLLAPYGLGALVAVLGTAAAVSMIATPLARGLRSLGRPRRRRSLQPRRVALTACLLLLVVVGLCALPLPVAQVRHVALIAVRPEALERIFLPAPATLERLHVRSGQELHAGEVIAQFRSLDLENRLEEARSERDVRAVQLEAFAELAASSAAAEQARLELARAAAAGEHDGFNQQVQIYEGLMQQLTLRAPHTGVVLQAPQPDEIGREWHPDDAVPFCVIGDPHRLRALVPVSPDDYRLLRDEATSLNVVIRVRGAAARRYRGRLAELPEAEAKELPLALTTRGGGPVPVRPGAEPNRCPPYAQQYLVAVDIIDPDPSIVPGCLAQVQFGGRWRPCAWLLWHALAAAVDWKLL